MKKITEKITRFIENFKNVHAEARKIGFAGVMRLIWKDLFVGRSQLRDRKGRTGHYPWFIWCREVNSFEYSRWYGYK